MSHPPEFFALQQSVAGRYSLVRELGRGGMGIVFLARDVALDRPVAIKLLPPQLAFSPDYRARFVREARLAARLSHPNIVPIHAVEERDDLVFFVMTWIDGETLGARVKRAGPLPVPDAARVIQEVAWALGHAHANGVVHRDVKPDNIMLERGTGRALVTDFGIARAAEQQRTSGEGRIIGTPRYMSPEQASGGDVDGRSDIYSLGCVAFLALTGRAPFEDASAPALLTKHVNAPAPPVRSVRDDIPPALAAAVDRCLAKSPADRPQTGDELAMLVGKSTTQQRDLPAPIRAFVADARAAGSEMATSLSAAGVSVALLLLTYYRSQDVGFFESLGFGFQMASYAAVAAAMGGLIALRLTQLGATARRLIRDGYGHSAVAPALLVQERAAESRDARGISRVGLLLHVAATVLAVWMTDSDLTPVMFAGLAGSIVIPTIALRNLFGQGAGRGRWSRWLRGRVGRWLFRLARVRLEDIPETPAAGEPTALALGHAVGELFRALPDSRQRQFSEVPALVSRLEADALELPARDARHAQAIAAIENLRLDLLRMHASSAAGSSDGDLTRDIDAARRVGDAIAESLRARAAE